MLLLTTRDVTDRLPLQKRLRRASAAEIQID